MAQGVLAWLPLGTRLGGTMSSEQSLLHFLQRRRVRLGGTRADVLVAMASLDGGGRRSPRGPAAKRVPSADLGRTFVEEVSLRGAEATQPPEIQEVQFLQPPGLDDRRVALQCGLSSSQKRRLRCRAVALRWVQSANDQPVIAGATQQESPSWCYSLFGRILMLEQEVGQLSRKLTEFISAKHEGVAQENVRPSESSMDSSATASCGKESLADSSPLLPPAAQDKALAAAVETQSTEGDLDGGFRQPLLQAEGEQPDSPVLPGVGQNAGPNVRPFSVSEWVVRTQAALTSSEGGGRGGCSTADVGVGTCAELPLPPEKPTTERSCPDCVAAARQVANLKTVVANQDKELLAQSRELMRAQAAAVPQPPGMPIPGLPSPGIPFPQPPERRSKKKEMRGAIK